MKGFVTDGGGRTLYRCPQGHEEYRYFATSKKVCRQCRAQLEPVKVEEKKDERSQDSAE